MFTGILFTIMVKSKWTKKYTRDYMREYIRKRRMKKSFGKREYELTKKRYERNPEQLETKRKGFKRWVKNNPDKVKAYYIKYNKKRKKAKK